MDMTLIVRSFLILAMCIMMLVVFVCMVRAIYGPRITDRVVALNMIGTLVVLMICIIAYLLEEAFLVDVAILYSLLNMLVVVILCRVANQRHHELEEEQEARHD